MSHTIGRKEKSIIKKKRQNSWIAPFCLLCFTIFCILSSCGDMPENSDSDDNLEPGASDHYEFDASISLKPGPWAATLQFYYHGNLYCYEGRVAYSLPAGFEFVGHVNNVAGTARVPRSNADFDGNGDGYLYFDAENPETAYFQWEEWDETASGREPYLICVLVLDEIN